MRFFDDNKIDFEVTLPEVVVVAPNLRLKNWYLAQSGRYYHDNPKYFREAIRFMQRIGDVEGERHIFMKSFNAGRERAFQQVVLPMVGVMAFPFVVEASLILASSPTVYSTATKLAPKIVNSFTKGWTYGKKMTYVKMGLNAYVQAKLADDGYRDIDVIAVITAGASPGVGIFSNVAEWKPFKDETTGEKKFSSVFLGTKSVSETLYDMLTQYLTGKLDDGIRSKSTSIMGSAMQNRTIQNGVNIFVKPMFSSFYEVCTQTLTEKGKDKLFKDEKKEIR